ncbi:hypothetical protein ACS0TY_017315 [Phlomoides rotata]
MGNTKNPSPKPHSSFSVTGLSVKTPAHKNGGPQALALSERPPLLLQSATIPPPRFSHPPPLLYRAATISNSRI